MFLPSVKVRDSRGVAVELYDPGWNPKADGSGDRIRPGLFAIREVSDAPRRRLSAVDRLGVAIAIAIIFSLAIFAIYLFFHGSLLGGIGVGLLLLFVGSDVFVDRWYRRWRHSEEVLRVLVSQGRCGSCGYELAGLLPEEDQCFVCPECGAAWCASRRHRSDPPRWVRPFPWMVKYIHDDRGWRCRTGFGWLPMFRGIGSQCAICIRSSCGVFSLFVWILLVCALVVAVSGTAAAIVLADSRYFSYGLLGMLGLFFVMWMVWQLGLSLTSEKIRVEMLRNGYCPSCSETLPNDPEPDGCHVCGLCGASWLTLRHSDGRSSTAPSRSERGIKMGSVFDHFLFG